MGKEASLLIAVAQFSCLSPFLHYFHSFSNSKFKTSCFTKKKLETAKIFY